jgi:hypothetical protein
MIFTTIKILISAGIIAFASWLSGKRPELAGFIVALPLMTLLTLAFSNIEYQDPQNSIRLARSVFLSVPLTMTFFIPFLLADKIPFGFWGLYGTGFLFLVAAYFVHRWLMPQ